MGVVSQGDRGASWASSWVRGELKKGPRCLPPTTGEELVGGVEEGGAGGGAGPASSKTSGVPGMTEVPVVEAVSSGPWGEGGWAGEGVGLLSSVSALVRESCRRSCSSWEEVSRPRAPASGAGGGEGGLGGGACEGGLDPIRRSGEGKWPMVSSPGKTCAWLGAVAVLMDPDWEEESWGEPGAGGLPGSAAACPGLWDGSAAEDGGVGEGLVVISLRRISLRRVACMLRPGSSFPPLE